MSTKHTPEPWHIEESVKYGYEIWSGGMRIAVLGHAAFDKENALRIIACVHALAGMDTGTIEAAGLIKQHIEALGKNAAEGYPGITHDFEQMRIQRGSLLIALREVETICTESASACRKRMGTRAGNALVVSRAAIAKAQEPPCKS